MNPLPLIRAAFEAIAAYYRAAVILSSGSTGTDGGEDSSPTGDPRRPDC